MDDDKEVFDTTIKPVFEFALALARANPDTPAWQELRELFGDDMDAMPEDKAAANVAGVLLDGARGVAFAAGMPTLEHALEAQKVIAGFMGPMTVHIAWSTLHGDGEGQGGYYTPPPADGAPEPEAAALPAFVGEGETPTFTGFTPAQMKEVERLTNMLERSIVGLSTDRSQTVPMVVTALGNACARVLIRAAVRNGRALSVHKRAFLETVDAQVNVKLAEAMGPAGNGRPA